MEFFGIDMQALVNVFAIISGALGIIAFMDTHRKRYKLKIKSGIGPVREVQDTAGAQSFQDGPAIEISFINSGLITMYPLSFHVLVNNLREINFSPKKPYDVLEPGRSIRHQLGKSWIYRKIKEQFPSELEKRQISLQVIVRLEDDLVYKSNVLRVSAASLESAEPLTRSRVA